MNTRALSPAETTYELATEVEYYRDPRKKDTSGWSGLATIISFDEAPRGAIKIKTAGNRELLVAPRDLRPATAYLALLSAPHLSNPHDRAFQLVRRDISHLEAGRIELFGQTMS